MSSFGDEEQEDDDGNRPISARNAGAPPRLTPHYQEDLTMTTTGRVPDFYAMNEDALADMRAQVNS